MSRGRTGSPRGVRAVSARARGASRSHRPSPSQCPQGPAPGPPARGRPGTERLRPQHGCGCGCPWGGTGLGRGEQPQRSGRGARAVRVSVPALLSFTIEDRAGLLALGRGRLGARGARGLARHPKVAARSRLPLPPPAHLAPADSPPPGSQVAGVRSDRGSRAVCIKNFYFKYIFCREKMHCLRFLLEKCQL